MTQILILNVDPRDLSRFHALKQKWFNLMDGCRYRLGHNRSEETSRGA
jgi:hypothetical protein